MPRVPRIKMEGRRYGRWRVLRYLGGGRYLCECTCPDRTRRAVSGQHLREGKSRSCRCLLKEVAAAAGRSPANLRRLARSRPASRAAARTYWASPEARRAASRRASTPENLRRLQKLQPKAAAAARAYWDLPGSREAAARRAGRPENVERLRELNRRRGLPR